MKVRELAGRVFSGEEGRKKKGTQDQVQIKDCHLGVWVFQGRIRREGLSQSQDEQSPGLSAQGKEMCPQEEGGKFVKGWTINEGLGVMGTFPRVLGQRGCSVQSIPQELEVGGGEGGIGGGRCRGVKETVFVGGVFKFS